MTTEQTAVPADAVPAEQPPNYAGEAELFAVQKLGRKRNLFYRRFDSTAEAVKFAIEDMPESASNLVLETEFSRLDAAGIAALYAAEAFPLERRSTATPQ